MITSAVLPDWPPPADEPIGEDRARRYIAWIREHAGPLISDARRQLNERYPNAPTRTSAATVAQLAERGLSDAMEGLSIGVVWCDSHGRIVRDDRYLDPARWTPRERTQHEHAGLRQKPRGHFQ